MPSDTTTGKAGPTLNETIFEVQGVFASDAALQDAISRLTLAGFDRADFSLPIASPSASEATPSSGADNPNTETDDRQARTLMSSTAAAAAAMVGAGVTIATGGAAAIAVAAAVGLGAAGGGLSEALHSASNKVQHDRRESQAASGSLVLAVHAPDDTRRAQAETILREAGATRVEPVSRTGSGLTLQR